MRRFCLCGLSMPECDGPTHRYIPATPECWALFGEVMAREYEDAVLFGAVHQLTVDAYAVQHAKGQPAKSLSAHLVSLHAILDSGQKTFAGREALLRFVEGRSEFPLFEPPPATGPLTIFDIAQAATREEHISVVRQWAEQVWVAWRPYHHVIESLVGESKV